MKTVLIAVLSPEQAVVRVGAGRVLGNGRGLSRVLIAAQRLVRNVRAPVERTAFPYEAAQLKSFFGPRDGSG